MSNFEVGRRYAAKKHRGQTRKSNGRDYFESHSWILASRALLDPCLQNDDWAVVMLLHDVVEQCAKSDTDADREVLYRDISSRFGVDSSHSVRQLTNEYTKARYPDLGRSTRKTLETQRLSELPRPLRRCKLLDRILNLQDAIARPQAAGKNYATESWNLGVALAPSNYDLAIQVLQLSYTLQLQEL